MSEKKYDSETLERLQEILRMMLADFDKFCEDNDIDYFLVGGSLLGAVRHNGMIPWDDDIDIGMTGKDYDKFIQIMKKRESDKYTLISSETNKEFPYLRSAGFMLNGTKFIKDISIMDETSSSIVVDIIAFDNLADGKLKSISQGLQTFFYGKSAFLTTLNNPTNHRKGISKIVTTVMIKTLHGLFKLFKVTPHFFINKGNKIATKYNILETGRVMYMNESKPFLVTIKKKNLFPIKKIPFDGLMISVPNNPEQYLLERYGDYKTLPPENKQYNHFPDVLDFGKYENLRRREQ